MQKERETENFVRLGADLKAACKLELCSKEYLPIIEAAIDGAISLKETEGAENATSVFS